MRHNSFFHSHALIAALLAATGSSPGIGRGWLSRSPAPTRRVSRALRMPHQGAAECARRVRQMANGTHGY